MSSASPSDIRWLTPPPQRTAYFCSARSPGTVLRVSRSRPGARDGVHPRAVAVATPESWHSRLSAVRSAVSRVASGARTASATSPGRSRSPSARASRTSRSSPQTRSSTRTATPTPANVPAGLVRNSPTATEPAGTHADVVRSAPSRRSSSRATSTTRSTSAVSRPVGRDTAVMRHLRAGLRGEDPVALSARGFPSCRRRAGRRGEGSGRSIRARVRLVRETAVMRPLREPGRAWSGRACRRRP